MGIDGIANDPFQLVSSADVQKFGFASCGRDGMVKLWTVDCSSTNQGKYMQEYMYVLIQDLVLTRKLWHTLYTYMYVAS